MHKDVLKVLLTQEELKAKVEELGKQITEDYKGEEVTEMVQKQKITKH